MTIHHPPTLINGYLADKANEHFLPGYLSDTSDTNPYKSLPFFPTMPTDIDALKDIFPLADSRFAVYDRMFRFRRTPFPHIKSEQTVYHFYKFGNSPAADIIEIGQIVQDYLDNGDESAQEINRWVRDRINSNGTIIVGTTEVQPVFFHSLKTLQLEEAQDTFNFGSTRTFAGAKIIVDYSFHKNYAGSVSDPVRKF